MIEILGISISKIWLAIATTSIVKLIINPPGSLKSSIGGIMAGALISYYGHGFVIDHISFFSAEDEIVVVIMLCLCGEHIMRSLMQATPEKIIDLFMKRIK